MSLSLFAMIASNVGTAAVDTVRLGLEAESARWFGIVKWAGYAVAIGCAMEAPETFILLRRWWLFRFKGIEREEDKGSILIPVSAIGLLVIVLGIVVETYCEGKVSDIDALLRAHESDMITAAENKAASATLTAGDAEDRAAKANERAAANEKEAAGLRKDAGRLNKLAEDERVARVKLEAEIAPRRLSPEQITGIAAACSLSMNRTFKGFANPKATVASQMLDAESAVLAGQIATALRGANMQVHKAIMGFMPMGSAFLSIAVAGNNETAAKCVRDALRNIGHLDVSPDTVIRAPEAMMGDWGEPEKADVYVLVGVKPTE